MTLWRQNWEALKEMGLTKKQIIAVWEIIDQAQGFRYAHISDSARRQIDTIYKKGGKKSD